MDKKGSWHEIERYLERDIEIVEYLSEMGACNILPVFLSSEQNLADWMKIENFLVEKMHKMINLFFSAARCHMLPKYGWNMICDANMAKGVGERGEKENCKSYQLNFSVIWVLC